MLGILLCYNMVIYPSMRLRRIRIKNFRSIYNEESSDEVVMNLSSSGNYIVGPNNVGKSNIFRALRLALRPNIGRDYNPELDQPKQMAWARPTITLDFKMERRRGPYKTLLKYTEDYERSILDEGEETFAENNIVRFYVQYGVDEDSRNEKFQAKGAGTIKGDEELLNRALEQFHDVVRLVDIESGEDLDSLLQRGFNELFTQVLSEGYSEEIEEAEQKRNEYYNFVKSGILTEIDDYIEDELSAHVSGINNVDFSPTIKTIEEAIGNVNIDLDDTVDTPLSAKGTGVRSLLIQMVMAFIADASRRSIVFAVEEPEAFLHPERHADLGRNLESFTRQSDISLLMTTHSPFILTNNTDAEVFTVKKDSAGKTIVQQEVAKELAIRNARRLLTGDESIPTGPDIIDSVSEDAEGILVLEGWTDKSYIETASQYHPESSPLESIHLRASEGATNAMKNAVVLKTVYGDDKSVYALLDDDDHGKSAYDILTGKLKFQGGEDVDTYREWQPRKGRDVEAEDLFSESLISQFIDTFGDDVIDGYLERTGDGGKHVEISHGSKHDFAQWVNENAEEEDCATWVELIDDIRDKMDIDS